MAPLGPGCAADGLGACETPAARTLTADAAGSFLEYRTGSQAPELKKTAPPGLAPSLPEEPAGADSGHPPEFAGAVRIAVNDLAERLGVSASAISVLSVEEVVWPDAAIGCPQPGGVYAQVMTDGLKIVLGHEGAEYAYHRGDAIEPFLCIQLELAEPDDPVQKEGTVPTEHPGGPSGPPDV